MKSYAEMTEEELEAAIVEKYGDNWKLEDLDPDSELFLAYWEMISTGIGE